MSRKNGEIEEREDRIKVKRVEGEEKRRCERRWLGELKGRDECGRGLEREGEAEGAER